MSFPKTGLLMKNFVMNAMIPNLITLESMLLNHYLFGGKKGGFIRKILEVGFNGIVGTTWAEDAQMMNVRSKDGKR